MFALLSLLIIILTSIVVVRIGAVALELTGLSEDVAGFQALSAFSGTGFTTSEAESIVNHPVRRRIVTSLILLGSVGFTSAIATFLLTFIGESGQSIASRLVYLLLGVVVIFISAQSRPVYRFMKKVILRMLKRRASLRLMDYQEVLGLRKGYVVSQFKVKKHHWMAGRKLKDLKLKEEGIVVFSIVRFADGEEKFIGVPVSETIIQEGDIVTCYGQSDAIQGLAERRAGEQGDQEHFLNVKEEKEREHARSLHGGYS